MAADCSAGGPHKIASSDRDRAKGGRGGMVRCQKCGKRLRLKPSGESVKGEVSS